MLAGIAPLVTGGLLAAGAIGGLPDEERNINVEPHQAQWVFEGLLEGVPVLAAEDSTSFCLPDGDACTPTNQWSFSYTPEQIEYAFDNRDEGTPHNLMMYNVPADQLDGRDSAISLSDLQNDYQVITPAEPPTFPGPGSQSYRWTPPEQDAGDDTSIPIPEQAYFVCTVHPSTMWGVVDITQA